MTPGMDWLKELLQNLKDDVDEVKAEVKVLNEKWDQKFSDHDQFKWKVYGAVVAVSAVITIAINILAIWVKWQ